MDKHSNNFDVPEELNRKIEKNLAELGKVSILLMGKTGVGKSTLINQIFREKLADTGVGKPVTNRIKKITKTGVPLVLYDTKGLELDKRAQEEALSELEAFLTKAKDKDRIDICYYLINAQSGRIEDFELQEMEKISTQMPVILVLTKYYGDLADEFFEYLGYQNLPVEAIVPVLAKKVRISKDIKIEPFGLIKLVEKTMELLDDEVRTPFINAQHADIDLKVKKAKRWAKKYISSSFGVGFVPIPFSDASVLVPMQIGMLAHITAIFGISMDKQKLVSLVAGIGGTGGATFLGRYIVSNVIKLLPGVGTVVGGLISGATASLITTALAMSYIESLKIICKREREGKDVDLADLEKLMSDLYKNYLKKETNNKNKDK